MKIVQMVEETKKELSELGALDLKLTRDISELEQKRTDIRNEIRMMEKLLADMTSIIEDEKTTIAKEAKVVKEDKIVKEKRVIDGPIPKREVTMYDERGEIVDVYESQVAAAKALGINDATVSWRVRNKTKICCKALSF